MQHHQPPSTDQETRPDLFEALDSAAAALIEVDPADSRAVSELRSRVAGLQRLLRDHGHREAAQRAEECLEILDSLLLAANDPAAAETVVAHLSNRFTDMQQGLRTEPDNATDAPGAAACSMAADPELLAGFVAESQEHFEAAESHLLILEADPRNAESLSAVFRAFHTIKGVAGFLGITEVVELAHEAENLLDRARSGEILLAGAAVDAALASVDLLKQFVDCLQAGSAPGQDPTLLSASANLQAAICSLAASDVVAASNALPHVAAPPISELGASPAAMRAPGREMASTPNKHMSDGAGREAVKVDRDRLDRLVDMIGELVIAESMVQQELLASSELLSSGSRNAAQLSKITRNLQELSLSLRMVPVRATFQKMARLARDLSKKINKPIDFQTSGDETELDKTVVDQIGDPLMHMVRNAVDHGIEASAAERVASGKPARGQVTMRAFHRGGNIHIQIEDDGRGLNPERILAKARQRGLIDESAHLTEREIFGLIFQPGFSTAETITDVSGRGVGMDVVRRNIEALRGSVELNSAFGRGTCFTMRLPLTLAIIDGMVVRVGAYRYIIPTLSVVELLRLKTQEVSTVRQRGEMFQVRERLLPLLRLTSLFERSSQDRDPASGITVVVEGANAMAGLLVDEVLGQQQAVIKNLGKGLEGRQGLAGGAIMPDGNVGLIIDVHGVLELARRPKSECSTKARA